jgi:hypothetical protein
MGRSLSQEEHPTQQLCQDGRKQGEMLTLPKGCTARTKDHGTYENGRKWGKPLMHPKSVRSCWNQKPWHSPKWYLQLTESRVKRRRIQERGWASGTKKKP